MHPAEDTAGLGGPRGRSGAGPRPLRIGTRGSPLALVQARMAAEALARTRAVSLVVVETAADRVRDRPLAELGGKALWTRELDRALLSGAIDLAVHSLKDVEAELADGIALAAVLARADPRDRLVGARSIEALAPGARVGTSSPRRAAQLRHRRPDVAVVPLRGNVGTRIEKVRAGAVDATFLAAAGLDRLGLDVGLALDLEAWLPAVAQGAIAVTARAGDAEALAAAEALDHAETRAAVAAERALLRALGGSCHTAVAAHARHLSGRLVLSAELYSPCGRERVRAERAGPAAEAEAVGRALGEAIRAEATPAMRTALGGIA